MYGSWYFFDYADTIETTVISQLRDYNFGHDVH